MSTDTARLSAALRPAIAAFDTLAAPGVADAVAAACARLSAMSTAPRGSGLRRAARRRRKHARRQ